jgi:uncharacterized membrane protein YfcA
VDIVLTLLLLLGGVSGAQFGAQMGGRLRGEETRALLGLLVLAVAAMLFWGLIDTPDHMFTLGPG